jgi:pilus assembly protein CpaE
VSGSGVDRSFSTGVHPTLIAPVPRISIQAFCESGDVAQVIERASADRRMLKAQTKVQMGGISAAMEAFRSTATPNLILIESFADRTILIEQLEALAACCDAGTKVIVIGNTNDIGMYRELTSRGVSDYLIAPLDVSTLIHQISSLYAPESTQKIGRIISVIGAKGGVGASTICHNLAWTISQKIGEHSIIVDLDLPFGTAGLDFNQDPLQGVADAILAPERLDLNFIDRLLWKCGERLEILAAPVALDRTYDLADHAYDGIIDILRSAVPATVLDIPHQWCGWTKRVLLNSDEIVIVATPDLANLRNAKMLIDFTKSARPDDQPPWVILNNVGLPREIRPPELFIKQIEASNFIVIPFDPKLFGGAANNGQMIDEADPNAKIVVELEELARKLMGKSIFRHRPRGRINTLVKRFSWKSRVEETANARRTS